MSDSDDDLDSSLPYGSYPISLKRETQVKKRQYSFSSLNDNHLALYSIILGSARVCCKLERFRV